MKRSKIVKIIGIGIMTSVCLVGCSKSTKEVGFVNVAEPTIAFDNERINSIIKDEDNIANEYQETEENNVEEYNTTNIKSRGIEVEETKSLEEIERENISNIVNNEKEDLIKLVNKENSLEYSYAPTDLISPNVKSTKNDILIREVCVNPLETMFYDANREGVSLALVSGFRSSDYQSKIYNNSLNVNGYEHTNKYVAKPGHSEHQTGLAVDISSASNNFNLNENFKNTIEGQWLKENAHKYGFILRYLEDRTEDTGYAFEPWHFRYVGVEVATYIYENNLILEDLF